MATTQEYQNLLDSLAALLATLAEQNASQLIQSPELAEALVRQVDEIQADWEEDQALQQPPPDGGLAQMIGLGADATDQIGLTALPPVVETYDETITSERILAVGDLYYIYQHEKVGVFAALLKLQELFRAGTIRLSGGEGAYRLYQYDRKQVLRYTHRERMRAYRRVFGYTKSSPSPGAKPNTEFHQSFLHFITQVAQFFRDKRISEVIRPRITDTSFGSIAVVRRAGLDLRNNLKGASYGHINVMRVEVLQLLAEAFRVLGSDDIRRLFGADNAWDVVEAVLKRHLNRTSVNASQRSRMAIAGRSVLQWLSFPHILETSRSEFEALLLQIADEVEEWLTSAETLNIAQPRRRVTTARNGRSAPRQTQEAEMARELW